MEGDGGRVKGADEASRLLSRARVAVAVAVIKSRPAGMSGREHAEALGRRLRSEDESWRGKAEGLRREVLRLRQELLIARATPPPVTWGAAETTAPDRAMDDASQDLFDTSDAPTADCDSETPELFLPDRQPDICLPEPDPQAAISLPRAPPTPSGHRGRSPQEEALHPHVHFLQRLCALQRVEGGGGLEALWFSPDGGAGESVLSDSVCQLLCSVAAACRAPPPGACPGDLVPRACAAAARAMDLFCSQRRPSAEFAGRVEESLRELTRLLLHGDPPGEAAETLVTCLVALGSSNMSRSFLIGHILSQLSAVADQLWQVLQVTDESRGPDAPQFPLVRYQNSCHLFRILEELLRMAAAAAAPRRVEVGPEQSGFLTHLQRSVFRLSDEFPLFSVFMWRIGGLLAPSDGAADERSGRVPKGRMNKSEPEAS